MRFDVRGSLYQFSIKHPVESGAYMKENGDIVYRENGSETYVMNKNDIITPFHAYHCPYQSRRTA